MSEATMSRLPLDGTKNTRELGGCMTEDKTFTKTRQFIRSDYFHTLDEADIAYLKEYGVTSVLDLRSDEERQQLPSVFENDKDIVYYPVSFMVQNIDNILAQPNVGVTLGDFYIKLLEEKQLIKKLMQTIENAPEGCMLFHCAAGKDRTGVLAMLLLSLVNVEKQAIVSNYQVSYTNIKDIIQKQYKDNGEGYPQQFLYSEPENMENCMNYLLENYKSTLEYFISCGVSEETLHTIKNKLI